MGEIWCFMRQLLFSVEWWVFRRFQRLYPQNLSLFSNFVIPNFFWNFVIFGFFEVILPKQIFLLKLLTSNSWKITKKRQNPKFFTFSKNLNKIYNFESSIIEIRWTEQTLFSFEYNVLLKNTTKWSITLNINNLFCFGNEK